MGREEEPCCWVGKRRRRRTVDRDEAAAAVQKFWQPFGVRKPREGLRKFSGGGACIYRPEIAEASFLTCPLR